MFITSDSTFLLRDLSFFPDRIACSAEHGLSNATTSTCSNSAEVTHDRVLQYKFAVEKFTGFKKSGEKQGDKADPKNERDGNQNQPFVY